MSVDNRTQLQDCDGYATDNWTAAAQGGQNTTVGQYYEGTGSVESQHSNSSEETWTNNDLNATTFNIDLSDSTVYLLIKDNLIDTYANGGTEIIIGDGTDRIGYAVGGNDAIGLVLKTGFSQFRLDVSEVVTTPGTNTAYAGSEANLAQTAITQIGYGSLHLAKAVGNVPNVFIDNIQYIANGSYALTINGGTVGTPETMADVAADDVTNGWGMIGNPLGSQYQFGAPCEWGNSAATADTYFSGQDEQWFFLGNNAGGRAIGANNFPFRITGNGTDTTSFVLTNVSIVNVGTRAQFDMSNVDTTILEFTSCSFSDLGTITLQADDSSGDKFFNNCTFSNCDKILADSFPMDTITFNGSNDADGAILVSEAQDTTAGSAGTQKNLVFNSDGTGHAIHIRPSGAGPFEFTFDNWTFNDYADASGTAADRVIYVNPVTSTADITINIINNGDTPSADETGYTGTLTINNSVTVEVGGFGTSGAAVKVIADATVGSITEGDTLSEGFADITNGSYSFVQNYEGDLDVIVRARGQGNARYVASRRAGSGQIDNTSEFNSSSTNDVQFWFGGTAQALDDFYFAHGDQFSKLWIEMSQAGVGTWDLVWRYYQGGGFFDNANWADIPNVVDGTNGLRQDGVVEWNTADLTGWSQETFAGIGSLWPIKFRLNTFTSTTTEPLGRWGRLNTQRYLPFTQNRIIESTGLTIVANWIEDNISEFSTNF